MSKNYLAHNFIHETLATIINPKLLESKEISPEAKEKASKYLKVPGFNVGAYSESRGQLFLRKNLAKYIERRDVFPINPDNIYLANGALNSYDHILQLIFNPGEKVLKFLFKNRY